LGASKPFKTREVSSEVFQTDENFYRTRAYLKDSFPSSEGGLSALINRKDAIL
jgi:hypothetical protein